MGTISVHDIEKDPTAFLARLAAGERLRIEDNGRTVAEVQPAPTPPPNKVPGKRPHGLAKGLFVVPDDFNDPMDLVPVSPPKKKGRRRRGSEEGRFVVPDDFNDPLPEDILRAFEGRDK